MTIRDILFPMISYPTATAADSIERAVTLAAGLGAHIVGVTFELDIRSPVGLYAHPVHISGIFAAERRKSASNARDLIAAFEDICARQGTTRAGATHEHAVEHCARARWLRFSSIMRGYEICPSFPSRQKTRASNLSSRRSSSSPAGRSSYCPKP